MRLSIPVVKKKDITEWHRWFAWYPVRITKGTNKTSEVVWLQFIKRRGHYWSGAVCGGIAFEYHHE